MYELKKMEKYLRVNLLGPGPRLMKKEFTGTRFHNGRETDSRRKFSGKVDTLMPTESWLPPSAVIREYCEHTQ